VLDRAQTREHHEEHRERERVDHPGNLAKARRVNKPRAAPAPISSAAVRGLFATCAALVAIGFAAALCAAPLASAQTMPTLLGGTAPAPAAGETADAGEIQQEIASFEAHAAEWSAKADEYERAQQDAPAELAKLDAEIARLRSGAEQKTAPENASLDQLEVLAIGAGQDLALAQREVTELQGEEDSRAERRRELPQLLAEAKTHAAEQPPAVPGAAEAPEVAALRATLAQTRRAAFEAEVRAYEQELLSYETRGRLLERRLALAQQRVAREQAQLDALQSALAEQRKVASERAVESALDSIREASTLRPEVREVVRKLAEGNAELARVRTGESGVLHSIDDLSRKLASVDQKLGEIDADFDRLTKKVAAGEFTDSLGLLLRKTRSQVPDVGKYRRFIRMRQQEIASVQVRQEELRDQLARLSDIDAAVTATVGRFGDEISPGDRARLESLVRELLETRRRHLAALLRDNELYFQRLVDFDAREHELIDKAEQLLSFIDQRILWIPSGGAGLLKIARDGLEALAWLASPRSWIRVARTALAALGQAPLSIFGFVTMLGAALWLRRPMQRRLHELAEQARAPTQTAIAPTLEALVIALAFAPWGPVALAFVGWRLSVSPEATLFVRSLAHGMIGAGAIWLSLEVPRQLVRRDGPAAAHFGWPEAAVKTLRREISWIASVAIPLVLVIQLFEARGEDAWRESVGRVALVALLVAVTGFTHRMMRVGGALRVIVGEAQHVRVESWVWRAAHVLAVAVPVGLAISAARGYYWTALRLGGSYHLTLVFAFVLLAALHLALRWTLLARRRLAFEKWRAEHEAQLKERAAGPDAGERQVLPEEVLDLGAVDVQTSRLLYTSAAVAFLLGLWVLWADLVPALGVLDHVELWSTTAKQTVELTAADGTRSLHTEERVVPITLGRLLVSFLLGFMTFVLVRNLHGMLEISLFQRLQTGPGERYAVTSIAKYALVLLGGVLAFNAIGIGWSNVQWLVAAMGLGLGFGLQEIFANFVSGLIILVEQPIRVGDTVTVGNVSGTVARIRIRATWITTFDRKELVVPNKDFVTSAVVNWSLSDSLLRVEVPVGVAYGSDTEAVMRELLAVADATEHVMADPRPRVLFLGFGDSTLNFELRVFSPDVDHTLSIRHDLHVAIDRAFRAAGIEIAFPQRDVHIRSVPGETSAPESGERS
jgi:potassium efflux system protein